ncbi:MAG: hypothetical protein Q4E06_00060 [Lautropia sp.]|nr:hypothetical protein [Lautropia sp.]
MSGSFPSRSVLRHALLAGATILPLSLAAPSAHALTELRFTNHTDGTPDFNDSDGPGLDSGPANRIVRTNDSYEYSVSFATQPADTNSRVVLTLPPPAAGGTPPSRWSFLPPECTRAGSSISADGQQLTCTLSDLGAAATRSVYFRADVSGTTRHGTALPPPSIQMSSSATPSIQPSEMPQTLTVSAAPFYDVQVLPLSQNRSALKEGNGPQGEDGFFHRFNVGLVARNPHNDARKTFGKKGLEMLDPTQPIDIELDVSRFPASVRVDNWRTPGPLNNANAVVGGFSDGCGSQNNGRPSALSGGLASFYGRVQDRGPDALDPKVRPYSVSNGGDCSVTSHDRNHIRLQLTGTDTSLAHTPTAFTQTNAPVPPTDFWVANKVLVLWTNIDDYPLGQKVSHPLSFVSYQGQSISGQTISGNDPKNDTASHELTNVAAGDVLKGFQPDASRPAPWGTVRDSTLKSGNAVNQMAAGQTVAGYIAYHNRGTVPHRNIGLCEIIDRTAFDIGPNFGVSLGGNRRNGAVILYGAHKSGSPYFASTDSAPSEYEGRLASERSVEGTSAYSTARCADPGIDWFDTPEKAEAAGGLVYVRANHTSLPLGTELTMSVRGLTLRKTWAATIEVLTPTRHTRVAGEPIPNDAIIRNRAGILSDTMPELRQRATLRDHLRVISAQTSSRIDKAVIEPATAAQGVPVSAGTTLGYRLIPRYATHLPPTPGTVTVTDVLPSGLSYIAASATVDGTPQEPRVQTDTPAQGLTTLTWTFADRTPHLGGVTEAGAALPAIEFKARAHRSLADGVILSNQAAISGGPFDIEPDCTYDPNNNVGYGSCLKAARVDVPVQSPPGFILEKSAARGTIEPGDPFEYVVSFVAIGQELRPPEIPDVIDVLPFLGDGVDNPAMHFTARSPASHFDPGAYALAEVLPPPADKAAVVYYTNKAPNQIHNDPQHESNRIPGGSTRWCLHGELGQAGCPADVSASTAIRVRPGITMLRAGVPYEIQLNMISHPVLAWPGSIFANRASSRPPNPAATLLYVESQSRLQVQVSMAMSSLSGRVFADIDQDNQFDADDWALPGQCVSIAGTNVKQQKLVFSMRTDAEGRFSFAEGAANRVHEGADCSGTPLRHFLGLMQGDYTLTRQTAGTQHTHAGANHAGSSGGTAAASHIGRISLGASTHATDYHFTDQPTLPQLTLSATVNNRHGGTAQASDVPLQARKQGAPDTGPAVIEGNSGSSTVTTAAVPAGQYLPGLSIPAGYRAGAWHCVVNDQPVPAEPLVLNLGDKAQCTVALEDLPARLTLVKQLDIRHGRQARVEDFMLHAEGQDGLPSHSGVTGAAAITAVEVPAGRYALREDNRAGFLPGPWSCRLTRADGTETEADMDAATVRVGNDEHAVCTITNTDAPLRVELVQVSTDDGGKQGPNDDVRLYVTPVNRPGERIPLKEGEAVSTRLVPGEEYELSVANTRGYTTKLICRDASQREVPLRLVLGAQSIGCVVERKRIPTEASVGKLLNGNVIPVTGTANEYMVRYQLDVQHRGGAGGHYDLVDAPAFDPDVEIVSHSVLKDGKVLSVAGPAAGPWTLASQEPLAMDARHQYQVDVRVRVPFGSNTANNRCSGTGVGRGLFNQVRMTLRQGEEGTPGTPAPTVLQSHACADTPEPLESAQLSVDKHSTQRSAELGEQVRYQLRIRNLGRGPARNPVVVDQLPAGFRLVPGSIRVKGARQTGISQHGRTLRITLDRVEADTSRQAQVVVSYALRVGVGSQEGDGINRVHMECISGNSTQPARCSNESRWKVKVLPGIFSEEACVAGQIFVDCNGNSVKDAEELGIPGVRLYFQNGTWLQSDAHGKYSHCGLRPRTHVLKVDSRTLPRRSRLVTSSAQNSGDAHSLFIDARKGMLHRADFIEGSCSATVIEQVKARQARADEAGQQTEAGQPALSFESKRGPSARPRLQGTDGANQPMSRTRH